MESSLRILEQGPKLENYNITNAVKLWHSCKNRRSNQKPHRTYRKSIVLKKLAIGSLSDSDTSEEKEIELFSNSDAELLN